MLSDSLILLVSLAGLLASADIFIDGVVLFAKRLDVSKMVIGLTVVAIGTSLPEAASSVAASIDGYPGIAFGNVVGSNICNVGLILGVPAVFFAKLTCNRRVLYREGVLMLFATGLIWVIVEFVGVLNRNVGIIFIFTFIGFLVWVVKSRTHASASTPPDERADWDVVVEDSLISVDEDLPPDVRERLPNWGLLAVRVVGSLAIILISSELLVRSTVSLARAMEISENVIALSLIALGTSLPELTVSIAAAKKNEGDILVGNILGSNISNILLVLGLAASIEPFSIDALALQLDMPLMVASALMMILFLHQKNGINRPKGIILLGVYGLLLVRCFAFPI